VQQTGRVIQIKSRSTTGGATRPEPIVEQALGVPMKRFERSMRGFLSREEMLAIIGKPGSSWTSQRDHRRFDRG